MSKNKKFVQVGTVAFFHNPALENYKDGGINAGNKDAKHPHVVIDIDHRGVATLVPMSSKGDVKHEKNVNHFIPPEAASVLSLPTWVLPQLDYLKVHVSQFPYRKGVLVDTAMDIVWDTYELYWDDLKYSAPELFVPLKGVKYATSYEVQFNSLASDVYHELGLTPLTLQQATEKALAKKAANKAAAARK